MTLKVKMTLATSVAVIALALAAGPFASTANAQFDHLKCYTVQDLRTPLPHAPVTLTPKDLANFGAEAGCALVGTRPRAKFLCTPVTKAPDTDGPALALNNNYACYTIKCPKEPADSLLQQADQYATGNIRIKKKHRTRLFCVPGPSIGSVSGAFIDSTSDSLF